jgi:hypothetical protein
MRGQGRFILLPIDGTVLIFVLVTCIAVRSAFITGKEHIILLILIRIIIITIVIVVIIGDRHSPLISTR